MTIRKTTTKRLIRNDVVWRETLRRCMLEMMLSKRYLISNISSECLIVDAMVASALQITSYVH